MRQTDVIIAPVVSEKSTLNASQGKFTFRVAKDADKTIIKKVIEEKFKVNVVSIATSIVKGRSQRFGARRTEMAMPIWKKATVRLKKDQKIDMFEIVSE